MSTHPPAHNTDAVPDDSQSLEPIYTDFLIQNDEAFATDYAETQLFGCRAPDSVFNMAQGSVVASEQPFSTYNSWDKCVDVDTYSWEECLELIEDHDWSVSNSEHERSVSSHGVHCASASLELAATSQYDSFNQATPAPDEAHGAKASMQLAEASGRCDFADTGRDPAASPTASQNNVTSDNATISIASLAPALHNAPESTPATTEQEITPVEKNMVIDYPLTPAMSVTDFQTTCEEAYIKPSPTAESEPAEVSHCEIEPRTATAPVSVRTTSHYRPPSITTHPTSTDDESPKPSPSAPTASTFQATDVQLILRPPQDFYRTYIAEKLANRGLLSGNDIQASARAHAVGARPVRALETKSAPIVFTTGPDTPPASPNAELQENDLSSVMAALASYLLSTHDLKRPFLSAEVVDGIEERATKKQRLAENPVLEDVLTSLNSLSVQSTETLAGSTTQDTSANALTDPTLELTPDYQINTATLPQHFGGAYTQPPDLDSVERLTTASGSPSPASASACNRPPPVSATRPAPRTSEALAQTTHMGDTEEEEQMDSDELSEASDEEISLLANEVFFPSGENHGSTQPIPVLPANTADAERPVKRRKMNGKTDGDGLGVRTTRGAARLAEERRRAVEREGCIKRRLRGRGGL